MSIENYARKCMSFNFIRHASIWKFIKRHIFSPITKQTCICHKICQICCCIVKTTYTCYVYICYILHNFQTTHTYAICSPWYLFLKKSNHMIIWLFVIRLYGLGFYDFRGAPWHISAADTMSTLTVYTVISSPLHVFISLDIVIL